MDLSSLSPAGTRTLADLRAAMPRLPEHTSEAELRQLEAWAGPDDSALRIAARGASNFGALRFMQMFGSQPETLMLAAEGGATMRRYKARFARLGEQERTWLACIATSELGFDVGSLLTAASHMDDVSTCAELLGCLVRSGFAAWNDKRIVMPKMRRDLVLAWSPGFLKQAPSTWLERYTKVRLASEEPFSSADRACLATCLSQTPVETTLDATEFERAVFQLRRTSYMDVVIAASRRRLARIADGGSKRESARLGELLGMTRRSPARSDGCLEARLTPLERRAPGHRGAGLCRR